MKNDMDVSAPGTQSHMISPNNQSAILKPYDFRPSMDRIYARQFCYQKERKSIYSVQMSHLIHEWLKFESQQKQKQLIHHDPSLIEAVHSSIQNLQGLKNNLNQSQLTAQHQNNLTFLKIKNPLSQQIIKFLFLNHPNLKRINCNLAETLINVGTFGIYQQNDQIPFIFYEEKNKYKCEERRQLGIILYGRLKLYNKIDLYQKFMDQNDFIGEHVIQSLNLKFSDYKNTKVKAASENETAVLWIKKHHYQILFKESMKCGLKQEIRKLQSLLKISWIRKALKKN